MTPRPDGKTILLVEDNPDDEVLARRAFEKSKLANEIVVARDGAEAVKLLHGSEDTEPMRKPQLVLLDLQLPKLDGKEVLRRIRAHPRTRRLPVVVLTSSDEERDLVESYDLGVNSYIRKPVDFEQFMESVKTVGLYWLVLNRTPAEES
ncbi:MAG: response regulator [Longimicrobiales bacterium]